MTPADNSEIKIKGKTSTLNNCSKTNSSLDNSILKKLLS